MKKLSAMQDALNTALANGKIEADAVAKDVRGKLMWYLDQANQTGFGFLFHDLQQIICKPMDDFKLLVTSRIEEQKRGQEAIKESLRVEEEAKARAKVEAEQVAKKVPNPFHYDNRPRATVHQIDEKPMAFEIIEPAPEPSRAQLIAGVAEYFGVSETVAEHWLIVRFVEEA